MSWDRQETLVNIGGICLIIFISVAISVGIGGGETREHMDALADFCASGDAEGIDTSLRDQVCPNTEN